MYLMEQRMYCIKTISKMRQLQDAESGYDGYGQTGRGYPNARETLISLQSLIRKAFSCNTSS